MTRDPQGKPLAFRSGLIQGRSLIFLQMGWPRPQTPFAPQSRLVTPLTLRLPAEPPGPSSVNGWYWVRLGPPRSPAHEHLSLQTDLAATCTRGAAGVQLASPKTGPTLCSNLPRRAPLGWESAHCEPGPHRQHPIPRLHEAQALCPCTRGDGSHLRSHGDPAGSQFRST